MEKLFKVIKGAIHNFRYPKYVECEEYIKAMYKLISYYKNAIEEGISYYDYKSKNNLICPLCIVCIADNSNCKTCPWGVFTKNHCLSRKSLYKKVAYTRDKKLMQKRINQIKEWIKKYQSSLEY